MKFWTTHEIAVLQDHAHMGPAAVSAAIWYLCGTRRSASACQRQASRLGISTAIRCKCPECGFISTIASDFTADGICRACQRKALAERNRAEVELLRSCASGRRREEFTRTLEQAERAFAKYRQQKHRLREEVGEDAVAEYEKASRRLSNSRSELETDSDEHQLNLF